MSRPGGSRLRQHPVNTQNPDSNSVSEQPRDSIWMSIGIHPPEDTEGTRRMHRRRESEEAAERLAALGKPMYSVRKHIFYVLTNLSIIYNFFFCVLL